MTIHKAWPLAAKKAIDLIATRFQRPLTNLHFGQATPRDGESFGVVNDELFITEPYLRDIDSPPPLGQLVEAQYQLQQPALFGVFIYLFSPHIYSPWRSDIADSQAIPTGEQKLPSKPNGLLAKSCSTAFSPNTWMNSQSRTLVCSATNSPHI